MFKLNFKLQYSFLCEKNSSKIPKTSSRSASHLADERNSFQAIVTEKFWDVCLKIILYIFAQLVIFMLTICNTNIVKITISLALFIVKCSKWEFWRTYKTTTLQTNIKNWNYNKRFKFMCKKSLWFIDVLRFQLSTNSIMYRKYRYRYQFDEVSVFWEWRLLSLYMSFNVSWKFQAGMYGYA